MHVYRTRVRHSLAAPYLFQQLFACQNIAAMANQIDEQIKERRAPYLDKLVTSGYLAPRDIDTKFFDRDTASNSRRMVAFFSPAGTVYHLKQ